MIKDMFMYTTVEEISAEYAIYDKEIILKIYQELYDKTDALGKPWDCKMIDEIIERGQNGLN